MVENHSKWWLNGGLMEFARGRWLYPLVNIYTTMENHPFYHWENMAKLTFDWAMFNSEL